MTMFASSLRLLTALEMQSVDRRAITEGIDSFTLMQAAGSAVANTIEAHWSIRPVAVLCGPGNNGGDGFVTAIALRLAGWPVTVALLGSLDDLSGDAAKAANLWGSDIEPFSTDCLNNAGLVVDAIFGAGLSRPIAGIALAQIEALNQSDTPVCAIDIPSGIDGSTGKVLGLATRANITVTFFREKIGHLLYPGRKHCGDIVLADIGIPSSLLPNNGQMTWKNDPLLWQHKYPWPQSENFKYDRGDVLILGGEHITGASRLMAQAAARAGAGIVTVAAPDKVWNIYASSLVNAIVRRFETLKDLKTMLGDVRCNVMSIGPGAGVNEITRQFVLAALATKRAVVLDADALTVFTDSPEQLFKAITGPCVLTPHAGEFKRLFNFEGDKLYCARSAAKQSNAVVIIKGADTVIASPDGRAIINANAPPQLATGGSGDVLSGFIAGLLAQGMPVFDAAATAVWLHGAAASEFGLGLIAQDLPELLPVVLQKLQKTFFEEK